MKTILLTFDLEEFPAREFKVPITIEEAYKIGFEGTKKILKLIKENNIIATCFVTYEFGIRYKKIIKEFEKLGCEIACHGFNHDHRYGKMNKKQAYFYIKKSFIGLKKLGLKINGFRAPQTSSPGYKIIEKIGFKYDSSLHPAWVPGYYNNLLATRKIFKVDKLIEIPISVAPVLKFPMAWIWFRNFGLTYEKILTRLNFLDMDFVNIYIHPYDLVDIDNKLNRKYIPKLILRNTGNKFLNTLDKYIKWCKKNNFKFDTINNYLKYNENNKSF